MKNNIIYHLTLLFKKVFSKLGKTYTAKICGHKTKRSGVVNFADEKGFLEMPLSPEGEVEYCLDCVVKMSIKCAWCGLSIDIGDPVTLYTPKKTFEIPEHAVRYEEDNRCLVGCLRFDCAQSGADRQGFWIPPGKVHRVLSPIEMMLSVPATKRQTIIINDLSDPNDLGKIIN